MCLDGLTQTSITKLLIAALNFLLKVIEKMPAAAQKNLSLLLFQRLQKILGEVKVISTFAAFFLYARRCELLVLEWNSSLAHIPLHGNAWKQGHLNCIGAGGDCYARI